MRAIASVCCRTEWQASVALDVARITPFYLSPSYHIHPSRLPRLLPRRLLRLLLLRRLGRLFGDGSRGVGERVIVRRVVDVDGAAAALAVGLGREELELLVPLDGGRGRARDGRSSKAVLCCVVRRWMRWNECLSHSNVDRGTEQRGKRIDQSHSNVQTYTVLAMLSRG